ncbi:MAG: zinc ribbon domain-containing protein, partial [Lachnospiraceae bacterium]|nr:zinc ribbon domain-containing protein [Lachnospiraceae bacterium]
QGQYRHNPYQQPYKAYDPTDHTADFDPADIADNKLIASMPYFLGIIGVIAALLVPGSPFTRYHIKHELRFIIATVLACIPLLVPVIGWILGGLALTVIAVLKIMAMIWVLQGKAKDIPIISSIGFLQ